VALIATVAIEKLFPVLRVAGGRSVRRLLRPRDRKAKKQRSKNKEKYGGESI
jgi:hypothetical protein